MATKESKASTEAIKAIPRERSHFTLLLATSPDAFKQFAFGNTTYEQLDCVGLNPDQDVLEAIVQIKQNSGYDGDICTPGSAEYVRFYADYAGSGTWQDLGVANVRVHNIPGPKPLCYSVKLNLVDPPRHFCSGNNVVKVRAILSWNVEPPPNTPDYPPHWGNVLETNVQVRPLYFEPLYAIFDQLKQINLPKEVGEVLSVFDSSTTLTVKPKVLSLAERAQVYKKAVPVHRFAFPELQKAASAPQKLLATQSLASNFSEALPGIDIGSIIDKFLKPPSDTTYEEVKCVGLRPEDDSVGAVLTIKQPVGYLGTLCDKGSPEYVGFWLKLDGSSTWEALGTGAVQVHDLDKFLPKDGVNYAVTIPVDLTKHRQLCTDGPLLGTLRAVLQWNAPPTDPTLPPHWGNIDDCRVQLRPGDPIEAEEPRIILISDQDTGLINQTSGLYNNLTAFGGIVAIGALYAVDPTTAKEFKIEVKQETTGSSWQTLMDPIPVQYAKKSGAVFIDCDLATPGFQLCHETLLPSGGLDPGWFEYKNSATAVLPDSNVGYWHTKITDEGLWRVRVTFRNIGDPTSAQTTNEVVVRIDNTPPTIHAVFEASAAVCGKYNIGDKIIVDFDVSDPGSNPLVADPTTSDFQHFDHVVPQIISGGVIPGAGSIKTTGTFTNLGGSGTFTLDTTKGQSCGYAFRIWAYENVARGWLSGASFNWSQGYNTFDLGFCLA